MAYSRKARPPRASSRSLIMLYGGAAVLIFGAAAFVPMLFSGGDEAQHEAPVAAGGAGSRSEQIAESPFPGMTQSPLPRSASMPPITGSQGKSITEMVRERDAHSVAVATERVERPACLGMVRNDVMRCQYITQKRGAEAGAACDQSAADRIAACNAGGGIPPLQVVF
jgi:hypothetical protein